jgi:acetyl-CoA C-acetyltransferase
MPGTVIVAGARTPIGKMSGAFTGVPAVDLGGHAIKAALERAGVSPDQVDYVFMGQVILAGTGQITARQAAVKAGIPLTVPATTVNKVCLSGLNAIYLADQMINAGDAEIVVAGGMESMTLAPYLLPGARAGLRMGDSKVVDSMMYDGLFCAFDLCAMGAATERYTKAHTIARDRQDALAAASHERASAAQKDGKLAEEIVAFPVPQRRGDPIIVDTDEGVRPGTTSESLGQLRPAFDADGTITAGNASQISDGGAAVIVMSKEKASALGVTPLAPDPAVPVVEAGPRQGGPQGVRRRSVRVQRGLRRRGRGVDGRPRDQGRHRERQRRGHSPRAPGGDVGDAHRPHPAARAAPAGRGHGRGRPLRGRGPG